MWKTFSLDIKICWQTVASDENEIVFIVSETYIVLQIKKKSLVDLFIYFF